jgi:hypothetical protein
MHFLLMNQGIRPEPEWVKIGWSGFLARDKWDDWFAFETQFHLFVADVDGTVHRVGNVKIGQFGLPPGAKRPEVPDKFQTLDERFFSLGQDANYYETLRKLSDSRREEVVRALRDLASDLSLFDQAIKERVTTVSLMREVTEETVRKRFSRIIRGDDSTTKFAFGYRFPAGTTDGVTPELTFKVEPDSMPPTNVHVLIGRNGVGKTRALNRMTRSLVLGEANPAEGQFYSLDADGELFTNLISVAFSAFDPFSPLEEDPHDPSTKFAVRYSYIGLQRSKQRIAKPPMMPGDATVIEEHPQPPKAPEDLDVEFVKAARACLVGVRRSRWREALTTLASDPNFEDSDVISLTEGDEDEGAWVLRAHELFRLLSSGHKIVLLTVTSLVQHVNEKTLVLLDEPEAHLHPPLLSAFVRCLSTLLVSRNGVAIVATHSPVVLQEVPKSCVWIINRVGAIVTPQRPSVETFGENIGVLTREVFGLEVTQAGYHKLVEGAAKRSASYSDIANEFTNQLGSEARAIAAGLVSREEK